MKLYHLIFTIILFPFIGTVQTNFNGNWEGVVIRNGCPIEKGTLLYLELEDVNDSFSGYSREEILKTDKYALKRISGSANGDTINFKQVYIQKSSMSSRIKWCRLQAELIFNKNTGYLEGNYKSIDCKRVIGKIILYRTDVKLVKETISEKGQYWFNEFLYGINEELNAPEIRIREREKFVFQPVFFDFNESNIRSVHFDFLDGMIKVIKGHSDLRVKVIGHTDSDGTDDYNINLSKQRAKSIIQYFVNHGLQADRLKFDFKGEKAPIDTNSTPQGKQRNRRVDFSFI
jgi:outer membrane protein OmpA-like peptidoglycan-associated protein